MTCADAAGTKSASRDSISTDFLMFLLLILLELRERSSLFTVVAKPQLQPNQPAGTLCTIARRGHALERLFRRLTSLSNPDASEFASQNQAHFAKVRRILAFLT